jgi:hypothetical protein
MNLARRIGKLEAIPERVPVPDRHDPHAMRVFAEGLVAAVYVVSRIWIVWRPEEVTLPTVV